MDEKGLVRPWCLVKRGLPGSTTLPKSSVCVDLLRVSDSLVFLAGQVVRRSGHEFLKPR